ncbi:MAG: DUF4384 domain-containing protein [Muribaculaceae bacterium]|nr:DUF4384 domain-containing protein [Muribaculaceae bacterium]
MKYLALCLSAVLLGTFAAAAQKDVKVTAEYTYYAPETMSIDEAKRTALDRAKIQAIADEFGTVVTQSNSTVISNRNGKSDTQFLSIGGTDVKGEWIQTTSEPVYDVSFADHHIVVKVVVKGVIRAIDEKRTNVMVKCLRNGTDTKYEDTSFKDNDDLFMYFSSPSDGYLTIFLFDEPQRRVYCILPYSSSNGEPIAVEHDKEYIFFSAKHKYTPDDVDELTLSCSADKEFNTLYAIFCPRKIGKASMSAGVPGEMPKNMTFEDFKRWMADVRKNYNDATVVEIPISIESRN